MTPKDSIPPAELLANDTPCNPPSTDLEAVPLTTTDEIDPPLDQMLAERNGHLNFMANYGAKLRDNGYSIIPIRPNSKAPGRFTNGQWVNFKGWNVYVDKPAQPFVVSQWGRWPGCGIGIMCGKGEGQDYGLVGFDLDVLDPVAAAIVIEICERILGQTPAVRIGMNPKAMLLYKTTETISKMAKGPIECLGYGQQFVAYGIHEKTGEPYQWPIESLVDIPIDRLPTVTAEQLWNALDEAYDALPAELKVARLGGAPKTGGDVIPFTGVAQPNDDLRGTPEACAEFISRIPNGDVIWDDWNRIGMALWSASTGQQWGWELFDEFSRRSSKYHPKTTASRWNSYNKSQPSRIGLGTLQHLAMQHDGSPIPPDIAFNEHKKAAGEIDISALVGAAAGGAAMGGETGQTDKSDRGIGNEVSSTVPNPYDWDSPDPNFLGSGRSAPPRFPLDVLGADWSPWVEKEAKASSTPVDYVACSLLAVAGALLGNSRWVQATTGWREPPVIWMGLVGSPSSGKSPGMSSVTSLIDDIERDVRKAAGPQLKAYKLQVETSSAIDKQWKKDVANAVKGGTEVPSKPDAAYAPDPPHIPKLTTMDVTPEALLDTLQHQPRGILALRDELAGLLGSFDRYNKSSGERALWIEAYGGRRYKVDRKTSAPIEIPHLTVNILGGIQPDRLREVLESPDDGLICRFLWCWPDPLPVIRLVDRDLLSFTFASALRRLYELKMSGDPDDPKPTSVPLTAQGREELERYAQHVHQKALTAVGHYAGALGKARGQVVRLALILEFLHWCCVSGQDEPSRISVESVHQAIALMEDYFLPMAARCSTEGSIPIEDSLAITLAKALKESGQSTFNASKLRYEVRGLRAAKKMNQAVKSLEEAGLVRLVPPPKKPGQRKKDYEVNPRLFSEEGGQV